MSSPLDVAEALAETILAGTDLVRVTVIAPGSVPPLPGLWINAPEVTYAGLGNGGLELQFSTGVFVAADIGVNYQGLLEYQAASGDKSVQAAVQANRSLGLVDCDCLLVRSRPLDLTEIAAYSAFGCAFDFSARVDPGSF